MAGSAREAVELQQLQHGVFPRYLGTDLSFFVDERQILTSAFCLAW